MLIGIIKQIKRVLRKLFKIRDKSTMNLVKIKSSFGKITKVIRSIQNDTMAHEQLLCCRTMLWKFKEDFPNEAKLYSILKDSFNEKLKEIELKYL